MAPALGARRGSPQLSSTANVVVIPVVVGDGGNVDARGDALIVVELHDALGDLELVSSKANASTLHDVELSTHAEALVRPRDRTRPGSATPRASGLDEIVVDLERPGGANADFEIEEVVARIVRLEVGAVTATGEGVDVEVGGHRDLSRVAERTHRDVAGQLLGSVFASLVARCGCHTSARSASAAAGDAFRRPEG